MNRREFVSVASTALGSTLCGCARLDTPETAIGEPVIDYVRLNIVARRSVSREP